MAKGKSDKKSVAVSNAGIKKLQSIKTAKDMFSWLVGPEHVEDFLKNSLGKKHFLIQRGDKEYYSGIFTVAELKRMQEEGNDLLYGQDVNASSYIEGTQVEMNGEGRLSAEEIDEQLKNGSTLQINQPQRFMRAMHILCYHLECYFGSLVGSNAVVTPAGTQGFAPHSDDMDSYVMQLEGSQRFRLYSPKQELARNGSGELTEEEIGEPILDTVLNAGDLLYMPRGIIYQSEASEGKIHSIHLALSTYQRHAWCDYLSHVMAAAFDTAIAEDAEFRETLPLDFYNKVGSGLLKDTVEKAMQTKVASLTGKLMSTFMDAKELHAAADTQAIDFMRHRLCPPEAIDEVEADDDSVPALPESHRKLRLKYPQACLLMIREMGADPNESEEEEEDEEKENETERGDTVTKAILMHSVHNEPSMHMMPVDSDSDDDMEGHEDMDEEEDEEEAEARYQNMLAGGKDNEEEEEEEDEEGPQRKKARVEVEDKEEVKDDEEKEENEEEEDEIDDDIPVDFGAGM
eukprot:Ihof_evm4s94 gene=Ihof_evmTU4s94